MLEFKTLEELKPNNEILYAIKNYTYKVKNGKTKHLLIKIMLLEFVIH